MFQVGKTLVLLRDIKEMPNFNPSVKNGVDSVSAGKVYWDDRNLVTCALHGAMLCVNPSRTIWRCPACHEGAFVEWDDDFMTEKCGN
ncbi:hypothetical protein LCGC14_2416460 [marine sediment metagenome]|uniref:Uncharacterized protein n=1 Tax=marine sediment metagenome TaxID=412755 RepID=A0A0F9BR10_9ZZZZ